jgi:hypothetical protein
VVNHRTGEIRYVHEKCITSATVRSHRARRDGTISPSVSWLI